MPTIKVKKEMNLVELIEWVMENKIKDKRYVSNNHYIVAFDKVGFLQNSTLPLDEKFTLEVKEEITEDTVLDAVVIVRRQISIYGGESTHACRKGNVSINQVLSLQPNNSQFVYLEIHLMKNDRIDKLIWTKEKGLIK
ncbi:hypothetical protein [Mammaliicoccus lentus]|uniref:hypothetical protein n=1 Tax=Mammaliicoccus lentus TaxID=42858 RepID=UPI001072503D|nr:hypothetical protein [Mammaliicoccus lentus]MBF0793329.1 hypothetical protein [Mammaliicoccus lentus]TFV17831.1 hypothetical protein E4T78_01600 [Mammaliicoccus lentus]